MRHDTHNQVARTPLLMMASLCVTVHITQMRSRCHHTDGHIHSVPRPSTTTKTSHNHPDGPHPSQGTLKRSPNLLGLCVSCAVARCDIRAPWRWRTTERGRPGLDGPLPWPTRRTRQQGGRISTPDVPLPWPSPTVRNTADGLGPLPPSLLDTCTPAVPVAR
ncbi:hypothetical protein K439DRAFT_1619483 [Ramaria rubella]|nr:hypothetical protein K439DRAFT_1619483 [Ramaria rubella]